jgi:hypothetical protein
MDDKLNESIIRNDSISTNITQPVKRNTLQKITHRISKFFSYEESKSSKLLFNKTVEHIASLFVKEEELCKFHFHQFSEMLKINLLYFIFGPFSVLPLARWYGLELLRNTGFWGKRLIKTHLIQLFFWMCFVSTVILTVLCSYLPEWKNQYIFLSSAYLSQVLVIIRYISVCVKYGYFPLEYYRRFKTEKLTRTEVKSNFLINGWIHARLMSFDIYLIEIMKKFSIESSEFKFQFLGKPSKDFEVGLFELDRIINNDANKLRDSISRRENKALRKINTGSSEASSQRQLEESSQTRRISLKQRLKRFVKNKFLFFIRLRQQLHSIMNRRTILVIKNENLFEVKGIYLFRYMLREIRSYDFEKLIITHSFITLLITSIPQFALIAFYSAGDLNNQFFNTTSIVFFFYGLIAVVPSAYLTTLNLFYGIIDIKRRCTFFENLSQMVDPYYNNRTYPLINVVNPETVLNWYYLRLMFVNYGKRFTQRIMLQATIYLIIMILSLICSSALGIFSKDRYNITIVKFHNIVYKSVLCNMYVF